MKRSATLDSLTPSQSTAHDPSADKRRRRKTVSPGESVIRNLLAYSKALTVLETNDHGYINLVMN